MGEIKINLKIRTAIKTLFKSPGKNTEEKTLQSLNPYAFHLVSFSNSDEPGTKEI